MKNRIFSTNFLDGLKKDFTYTVRHLNRNRLVAFINVLSLSIGIGACLVIFLIINYELSFDRFQPDRERIFRIYHGDNGINPSVNRGVETAIVPIIKNEFTGLEGVTHFRTLSFQVKTKDSPEKTKDFGNNRKVIFTEADYFEFFDYYEWLAGTREKSLNKPFQVVLTESRAKLYFGNISAHDMIGKELVYGDTTIITVSGIVKDIPENTDLDFTDFVSFNTLEKMGMNKYYPDNDWGYIDPGSQLFIKTAEGTPLASIESQLQNLSTHYKKRFPNEKWVRYFGLQPLSELHFNTTLGIFNWSRRVAEKSTLAILSMIAVLLLVIASINFVNLETAQSSTRAKEVGIRKALGSTRSKLIAHFMTGSFILGCCAVVLSIALAWCSIHYFTEFVPPGAQVDLTDTNVLIFLASCILAVTFLAGLYPAIVLSGASPVAALKNMGMGWTGENNSAFVRKGLTVLQFSISQILIVGAIAIGLQIQFMLNKDLGFATDSIVYFHTPWNERPEKKVQLKNELEKIPGVEKVTIHGFPPTALGAAIGTFNFENGKETLTHQVYKKYGDESFLSVYDIELLAGRNISASDTAREYLINETYLRKLGFDSPHDILGKTLGGRRIVGVTRDFHVTSLHDVIAPVVIYQNPEHSTCMGIKLSSKDVAGIATGVEKIKAAWSRIYPDEAFEVSFLNETVESFYRDERRTGKLARTATGIAILISCLGLFGLSSFTVIRRTKEIGIRKALGASARGIVILLSTDFLSLVLLALVLSAPFAYYLTNWWLQNFAYRMEFSIWIYIFCGVISLVAALLTISLKTVGAAKANPVDALRYE